MLTAMNHVDVFLDAVEGATAEAVAAIGLRGAEAQRAMRAERRRRNAERFRRLCSRVPVTFEPADVAQARPWVRVPSSPPTVAPPSGSLDDVP